jgi:hypothetical protein
MRNRFDGPSQQRTIDASPFFGGAQRRLTTGYPVGGVWGSPGVGRDANGDGVVVPSEIIVGTDPVYLGSSVPTREAGLVTSVTLFRRTTLAAQIDYHGGFQKRNETEAYRCDFGLCQALYDPSSSVADQVRAVEGYGTGAGFMEKGDFARVREVRLPGKFPRAGATGSELEGSPSRLPAGTSRTFTSYSGLDPEVNMAGQSSFGSTELFTLPLPRTWLVRLDMRR